MEEEDDADKHWPGKGLPLSFPVLLEDSDNIMVDDIERMVEEAHTFDKSGKNHKQLREELYELDEIVEEFTR